jgi:signal transduction histidine kinase
MSIRNKLLALGLTPLLVILILAGLFEFSQDIRSRLRLNAEMADELGQQVETLSSLSGEYLQTGAARPRQQLRAGFDRLHTQLQEARSAFQETENRLLAEEIDARIKQARWSFEEYERITSSPHNAAQDEYHEDISERLRIELRTLQPLLHSLHHGAHLAANEHQQRENQIGLAAMLGGTLLIIALALPLMLRLRKALAELGKGSERIGAGDLGHSIHVIGNDELADLARQFNAMSGHLQQARASLEESNVHLAHRSSELETANKDLEGFSYSVSHDLRAPLRAIDGFIAILVEDYGDKLDAEAARLFGVVRDNARKMGELIDDILAFSRAGRLEIQLERIDMNAMADEVWAALAEERHDRVVKFSRADLPPVVADPRAIRQIWQNLLGNAIKFSRTRPIAHIAVESRRSPDGGMLEYSVRDDGVGFNPEYAGKLFVLFQRLHGMDEFEGTGVGLSLVKRFVQKHHGEIVAESQLNEGATFRFSLPDIPMPEYPLGESA